MHLLTLPDELFVTEIFLYLHSADLIRAFGTLGNTRLVSLIYAHIRHLDLPDAINCIEALRHYQWNQIRSLCVHEDHLDAPIAAIFPSLDQLIVRMSSSTTSSSLLSRFTRLNHLRLSFSESERPSIVNRVVRDIWHVNSRVARLSMHNCIFMDERYFTEISSSLIRSEYLTHLSLIVACSRTSPSPRDKRCSDLVKLDSASSGTSSMVIPSEISASHGARDDRRHRMFMPIHPTVRRFARTISRQHSSHAKLSDGQSTNLRRMSAQSFTKAVTRRLLYAHWAGKLSLRKSTIVQPLATPATRNLHLQRTIQRCPTRACQKRCR